MEAIILPPAQVCASGCIKFPDTDRLHAIDGALSLEQ